MKLLAAAMAAITLTFGLVACGEDSGSADEDTLTIYSGRQKRLVGPLIDRFQKESGLKVEVRYGESAELAATIGEEGERTPADVFFSQDAGALGAVQQAGLLTPLPASLADRVDARYRDESWIGTSGRSRVVAYSTERLKASEVPDSILDFCDDRWKGRIGFPPPNASFQSFVSAMRLAIGDDRTREWLECMEGLEPTLLENNIQTEEAIADGEIDVGFVNHYYLGELKLERPDFPVANRFLKPRDPGSLINVAGVGILEGGNTKAAEQFALFLLSKPAQEYVSQKLFEYPLVAGVPEPAETEPLEDLQGPDIALSELGEKLPSTLELLRDVGLTP